MQTSVLAMMALLGAAISSGAEAQAGGPEPLTRPMFADTPVYRVSFERRDAVTGISASGAIKLPFECTTDGTVFVSFVSTVPAGLGLPMPPPVPPPLRLVSFSPSGKGQTFELSQIPDLYVSSEIDHYVNDSDVIFLVSASRQYKPEKHTYPMKGGGRGEFSVNSAEQHRYILMFSRDGTTSGRSKSRTTCFTYSNLVFFHPANFLPSATT